MTFPGQKAGAPQRQGFTSGQTVAHCWPVFGQNVGNVGGVAAAIFAEPLMVGTVIRSMAVLSFPKGGLKGSASDIVEYLEARALERGQGYYSHGAAPSSWGGALAAEWDLRGPVDARTFKNLLEGVAPDGVRFAETSETRRMGKDLTANAPKSCSIAMVAGDEKLRQIILEGHRRANQRMMEWVEKEYVTARYGKGGKEVERTGQALWVSYQHEDARTAGEPSAAMHLHDHNILLNITRGRDGKLRALDIDFGVDGVHLAGAVYQAEYAAYLREQGVALRACDNGGGGWELAAITDEQIRECSPRSAQIVAELERQGLDRKTASATQKSAANQRTRGSKAQLSQDDQRWEWRSLCRRIGVNLDSVYKTPEQEAGADRTAVSAVDALAYATDHLSEREAVINGQSTRLHALRVGALDGVTIDILTKEIAHAREAGNLINAGAGRLVTRESLTREVMNLETVRAGHGVLVPLTTSEGARARVEDGEQVAGFQFTEGQREAVVRAITTGDQYYGIRGAAGAGKSTALAALADEARAQGFRVIGTGPSQTAVDGTKDANPDDARVLASFNTRDDKDQTPRLILMDEAGMVSSRDMESFLQKVRPTDRVVFIGDPLQLAAVEAGSPFAQMMKEGAINFSEITEINRQKDKNLLAVAQAFADGRNQDAVKLAEPYMSAVAITDDDYKAVDAAPEPQAPPEMVQGEATEAMTGYVKSLMKKDETLEAPAHNDFKTVRAWLDAHSNSELGYKALEKTGKQQKLAPQAVRVQAIARETADAYLRLSPEERANTLVMAATHDMRKAINFRIREGLNPAAAGTGSVTMTALDKSALTRAQLRQAVNYKVGQVLRVPEGCGKARKVVDWTITATDPTRNAIKCKDTDGVEKVFHPRDLDPKRVGLYTTRSLDLSPGDRILFTENNRGTGFKNNETGTVATVDNGKVDIKKDSGQIVTLDPAKTHTLDHGWAITVHRSQGRTIDRALVAGMASKVATAVLAYVACSRERWSLQVFTDNIKRLQQSWARVADRETALDATRAAGQGQEPDGLQKARDAVRTQIQEQHQEGEQDQEPTPAPARRPARERDMGFDLEM